MPPVNDLIKSISSKASEEYLICKTPMNDYIFEQSLSRDLNEEIVRRICEHANQNVYLTLFHDGDTDRSNIKFDLADSKYIIDKLRQSESKMEEYKSSPKDFRNNLEIAVISVPDSEASLDSENEKVASLDMIQFEKTKYEQLLSGLETLKTAELNGATENFQQMFNDSKLMTHKGESVGDMSKIACRFIKEKGLDFKKVASAYQLIIDELGKNGYDVNTDFTKISSLTINKDSDLLKPVNEYIDSIYKIAAINEMTEEVKGRISEYKKTQNEIVSK